MNDCLLQVDELIVRFGKAFEVGPMSLRADHGIVHLAGANGSGKTSLLRAISGELLPAEGRVRVRGLDVHRRPHARPHIALASSAPELPGFLTVQEAWQFTASLRGAPDWRGTAYCEALELPPGLSLAHGSAGQRRKAELVCALAGDPSVLLLDESFAHLDQPSAQQLSRWLTSWAGERLILLTHHGEPPLEVTRTITL